MEKEKSMVGILTHFYNSDNYGGVLQAYALCRVLNEMGYDAEQIQITIKCEKFDIFDAKENRKPKQSKILKRAWNKWNRLCYGVDNICESRKKAVLDFAKMSVPHSREIYSDKDVIKTLDIYDVFITGSDQVWNMDYYMPAFFLDFVPDGVPKFSYAASIAKNQISESEKSYFKETLRDYIGISVREENAIDMLSSIAPVQIQWVVDPVFLLSKTSWEEISADRLYDKHYIFCYFLGNNSVSREIAIEYAKMLGYQIVTMQYLAKEYSRMDRQFGDIRINDASPPQFISLIRNAELVVTDSFHAVAFSLIFEKKFIATQRTSENDMISRLDSILHLVNENDKYISNEVFLSNKGKIPERYHFEYWKQIISEKREASMEYIRKCMKLAEKRIK